MTNTEKIINLLTKLDTKSLTDFVVTCPESIFTFAIDELETRMPEREFIELCNSL